MKHLVFAMILAGLTVVPAIQAGVVKATPNASVNGRGIQITAAPEPASMFLLGSGLFAMGAFKVRKSLRVRRESKKI